jgi:hypothetical protein
MTKLRPLGNRRSINIGGLIMNVREGTGSIKMASEFYLMDSNTQLNLLDDWINSLEALYNAEIKQAGTIREQLNLPTRRRIKHIRQIEKDYE